MSVLCDEKVFLTTKAEKGNVITATRKANAAKGNYSPCPPRSVCGAKSNALPEAGFDGQIEIIIEHHCALPISMRFVGRLAIPSTCPASVTFLGKR
jgi:hypothetical protein